MPKILVCLIIAAWTVFPAGADAQTRTATDAQTRTVTVDGQTVSVMKRPSTRDPGLSRDELVAIARKSVPSVHVAAEAPPLGMLGDQPR
jgi:hypothetical protein